MFNESSLKYSEVKWSDTSLNLTAVSEILLTHLTESSLFNEAAAVSFYCYPWTLAWHMHWFSSESFQWLCIIGPQRFGWDVTIDHPTVLKQTYHPFTGSIIKSMVVIRYECTCQWCSLQILPGTDTGDSYSRLAYRYHRYILVLLRLSHPNICRLQTALHK